MEVNVLCSTALSGKLRSIFDLHFFFFNKLKAESNHSDGRDLRKWREFSQFKGIVMHTSTVMFKDTVKVKGRSTNMDNIHTTNSIIFNEYIELLIILMDLFHAHFGCLIWYVMKNNIRIMDKELGCNNFFMNNSHQA